MSELGDALALMVGAAERVPTMRAVHTVKTFPGAAAEARRLELALPVPFGMLRDLPDDVITGVVQKQADIFVRGACWCSVRREGTSATMTSPDAKTLRISGFDGQVSWQAGGGPAAPPPSVSPSAKLLDPSWLLSHRTVRLGQPVTAAGRSGLTVTAEWRAAGQPVVPMSSLVPPTVQAVIDGQFGFLLQWEQLRDGQPLRAETLSGIWLDDPTADDLNRYRPPPGAARSDDRDDTWARISRWQQRLATAAPLALGAWRVLRGRPAVPSPPQLQAPQHNPDA